jgi:hypothetical protein
MTRHRQNMTRPGSTLIWNSPATLAMGAAAGRIARQNARRIACSTCRLLVLPADMARHVDRFHGGGDD